MLKYSNRNLNYMYNSKSENAIVFSLVSVLFFPFIDFFINNLLNIKFWDSFIINSIHYTLIITALHYSVKRLKTKNYRLIFLLIFLFLFSFFFFPLNRPYLSEPFIFFVTSIIPSYLISLSLIDYKKLYNLCVLFSRYSIFGSLLLIFLLNINYIKEIEYLSFSFLISFSVVLTVIHAFSNKTIINLLAASLGLIMLIILGSRSAILGVFLSGIFYLFIVKKLNIFKLLILTLFVFYIEGILLFLLDIFKTNNLNSRSILLFLDGSFTDSSGRNDIYKSLISLFSENPIFGYGLKGDVANIGVYSHNLFIELLFSNGLIIGGSLSILLISLVLKPFFQKRKNELFYIFYALLFSNGFFSLLTSSTFLSETNFYLLIAFSSLLLMKKQKNKNPILN